MSHKTKIRKYDIILDNGVVAKAKGTIKFTCTVGDVTNYHVSVADKLLSLGAHARKLNSLCNELQNIFKAKVIDIV